MQYAPVRKHADFGLFVNVCVCVFVENVFVLIDLRGSKKIKTEKQLDVLMRENSRFLRRSKEICILKIGTYI